MTKFLAATAQLNTQILDLSDWFGFDPFGRTNPPVNAEMTFFDYVTSGLTLAAVILFIAWIVMILWAAIKIITSFGNTDQLGEGLTTIKNVIIGIFLLFVFVIVLLVIAQFFRV